MFEALGPLPVEEVAPGTNLLVVGPPMTGKAALATGLVEAGCRAGQSSVLVLNRDSARRMRARNDCLDGAVAEGRAGVVDCVSRERGLRTRQTEWLRYVSSPASVTDIGIRLGGFFEAFARREAPARVGLVSLSTMLMYVELRRVFRFLHVFTGKVKSLDWLSVAVMETGDGEALDALLPLFDGVVRTREQDGRRELRVVGLDGATDWTPY
ncbi:MAG: RAD55 family ATPase [Halobacteriaceae archaeon]